MSLAGRPFLLKSLFPLAGDLAPEIAGYNLTSIYSRSDVVNSIALKVLHGLVAAKFSGGSRFRIDRHLGVKDQFPQADLWSVGE
jgi:hypothetical protein